MVESQIGKRFQLLLQVSPFPRDLERLIVHTFLKTQRCKFGLRCKFNHPKDKLATVGASENGDVYALPERPSEPRMCVASMGPLAGTITLIDMISIHLLLQSAILFQRLQLQVGASPAVYPQRFGQAECEYYMKTGECKYGAQCRFHHPIDRPAVALSTAKPSQQENVKLTLAGLPRREGAIICVYYLKTGTCKYGATCRFDHPPPGEFVAMAASQAKSDSTGGKA